MLNTEAVLFFVSPECPPWGGSLQSRIGQESFLPFVLKFPIGYADSFNREVIMKKNDIKLVHSVGSYRFGVTAFAKGYVNIEQVQRGLAEQVDDNLMGRPHRLLGYILRDKGWITEGQMKAVLVEMGVERDLVAVE
jgi:hypothetical protein